MSGDLRELLAQAAVEVQDPLDVDDLRRRGRQVQRRRRAVAAGGAGLVVVAVATGVLAAVSGLPSRPDVAVNQGPTPGPSVTEPSVPHDQVAAALARSASQAIDVTQLADGKEVERLRNVLGDLDVVGTERVLPGRWGNAWRESGQLVRVAASAAVYPEPGEPFCVLVALAPDGRFAGVPATGDAYGGCGEVTTQSTADDALLRGLIAPEPSPSSSPPDLRAAITDQLNAELSELLQTAEYIPLGGDHDIGYATESFEVILDDGTTVLISVGYAADNDADDLVAEFQASETRDGGGAAVMLGSWPGDAPGAVVACPDRTLTLRTAEQTMDGSAVSKDQRTAGASRAADQLAAAWGCAGLDG